MSFSKFLDPKLDLTFKKIFGTKKNKKILIHFLNDILGCTEINTIQEIEFINTVINPETPSERQSIVDVLCQDSVGNKFVVEMQLARDKGFEKRAQLYAAKVYSRQTDKYANLQKVFFIAISNCTLFPDKSNYISSHTIRDDETNEHDLKDFQFVFIELSKFPKNKVEQLTNIVERWCFFFKYADETTDEDLKKIAKEAPIIKLAYDELDRERWEGKELTVYEKRMMDLQKEEGILEYKFEQGIEKGVEKGREEGIEKGRKAREIEMAKAMLANNVDVDAITKYTGLSSSEIEKLN